MGSAKYRQIADLFRENVRSGAYRDGDKAPSENLLAAQTGFSRTTIRQAMMLLEKEGLVRRVQGSGTYICTDGVVRARSMNIGVITACLEGELCMSVLRGINEELNRAGYTILLAETRNRVDEERRILKSFLDKPLDGLMVEGTRTALPGSNLDLYQAFADKGIPLVFFNGCCPEMSCSVQVTMDERAGGRLLTEMLIARGHRRIAGLFSSDDIRGRLRYAGYMDALKQAGVCAADDHVLWYTAEDRQLLIDHRIRQVTAGCTAAVCGDDEAVFRAIQICGRDALQWAGFDDSAHAWLAGESLISLIHPKKELGRIAAEKMLGLLRGSNEQSVTLQWHCPDERICRQGASNRLD